MSKYAKTIYIQLQKGVTKCASVMGLYWLHEVLSFFLSVFILCTHKNAHLDYPLDYPLDC